MLLCDLITKSYECNYFAFKIRLNFNIFVFIRMKIIFNFCSL